MQRAFVSNLFTERELKLREVTSPNITQPVNQSQDSSGLCLSPTAHPCLPKGDCPCRCFCFGSLISFASLRSISISWGERNRTGLHLSRKISGLSSGLWGQQSRGLAVPLPYEPVENWARTPGSLAATGTSSLEEQGLALMLHGRWRVEVSRREDTHGTQTAHRSGA